MPYPPRPPTTQAIGAALKRAGISRSEWMPGAGLSPGYRVRKSRTVPSAVEVLWRGEAEDRTVLRLLRMADVIVGAGFRCRLSDDRSKITIYASTATIPKRQETP